MIKIIDINFLNKKSAVGCFLLKENNNFVLVETGPSLYYEEIKKSLNDINVDIKKIKNVLVTHIHLDHSGGAWKFAKNGASIYVHPKGAPHLISPEKLISSASMIYGNDMDRLWGKVEKINSDKSTVTKVHTLNEEKTVREIARMLSGELITSEALAAAATLRKASK